MNKIFHGNHNKTDATEDDVVALAIQQCQQENDDMKKQHKRRIQSLERQVDGTRVVMQAMVLVARISPEEFFALLDEEGENWNLADLKYVAAAIHNQLQTLKQKQAKKQNGDDVGEMEQSTAQRLYTYVMMDPKADKKTVIQVISELHKELALLEELVALIGKANQPASAEAPVPKEIQVVHQDTESGDEIEGDVKSATATIETDADSRGERDETEVPQQ